MGKLHAFGAADDLTGLDAAWFADMRERSAVRPFQTGWTDEQDGGVHRFCLVNNLSVGEEKVLDGSIDWRDRLCFVVGITTAWGGTFPAWTACFPGGSRDFRYAHAVSRVWYAGPGTNSAASGAGYHLLLSTYYKLYARSTDGALVVHRSGSDPVSEPVAFGIRVISAEQTGEVPGLNPPAQPSPSPVDTDPILPSELNTLQDHGLLSQGLGGTVATDALPLGSKATGNPPLPEAWTVHGSERRQSTVGTLRRYFVASLGNLDDVVLLDAKADWRDRFMWACGRIEQAATPLAIGPGGGLDYTHNTKESWVSSTYTSSGGQVLTAPLPIGGPHLWNKLELRSSTIETFAIWASDTDGSLYIGKDRGDPAVVTGWIEASFPLSSERSSDR